MLDCLINWLEFNSSWLAPLISAFAAISSFLAAISAKKAAKSNRVTALGQIVNVLEREYESNEMMKAIHRIKGWKLNVKLSISQIFKIFLSHNFHERSIIGHQSRFMDRCQADNASKGVSLSN